MARKAIIPGNDAQFEMSDLMHLIEAYGEDKEIVNKLTKSTKTQNEDIKKHMIELCKADKDGKRICDTPDWIATLSMTDKSTMNEEKLIAWLKKNKLNKNIVKRKEYVDEKALESAIYNGEITEEQVVDMEVCKDVSLVEVLRVTKKKKGDK